MKAPKRLGIYMDHSNANLIEFTNDSLKTRSIESTFTHEVKVNTLGKSEHIMHNKEQHQHAEFYKKLGNEIRHFDETILFGPTDAKVELCNLLRKDHLFTAKKIFVQDADKMTDNQQHAFVKDYFSKH